MVEVTRRRALTALGAGAVGAGWYWHATDDQCIDSRDPRWTFDGKRWSPAVKQRHSTLVAEGHGYTGSGSVYRLVSLASNTGEPDWMFAESGAGFGVPTFDGDTVYVGSGLDKVYALDANTGRLDWEYDAGGDEEYGGGAWGRPALTDGLAIVGISHSDRPDPLPSNSGAYAHRVVALDEDDGSEVWSREVDRGLWTGPVVAGRTVVAATEGGVAYGLGVESGEPRWEVAVGTEIRQSLFETDGVVFVASQDGRVVAFDAESGAERWSTEISSGITAFERAGDSLFVGTDASGVLVLARSSGETNWRYEADASVADFGVEGARAFVLDQQGHVHALTVGDGERVARFRVAADRFQNRCGWIPDHEHGSGLLADDGELFVTGPWVRRFSQPE